MPYKANLYFPFLWFDGIDILEMDYIPNGFNKESYSDGVLEYEKEFRSRDEAINFIEELLKKFSNLLKNNNKIFINAYGNSPSKEIDNFISSLKAWKNVKRKKSSKYYNNYSNCFNIFYKDDYSSFIPDYTLGKIEISEKNFTYNFSLFLTEEEYDLINSDVRFKVTHEEIKEAVLNCYRGKEGK